MALVAKAFQDIITFSRASSGTYVNSNGYITNSSVLNYLTYSNQPENAAWTKSNSFVQQNLVLWSEDFTNVVWGKSSAGAGVAPTVTGNQGIAPDGTLTADRIDFNCGGTTAADRSWISQTVTVTTGAIYTDAIYFKAFDAASVGKTIRFVLENGGASGTNIFTLTTEWQRISVTGAGATGASINVLMETRGTYTSSTTASVLLWGAQLVQGSVPGDYRATTSAALPCLYADYNGALRARKLCESAINALHINLQIPTVNASTVYTLSEILKAGERTKAALLDGAGSGAIVIFDLQAGTVVSQTNATGTITSAGNGYYRCSATMTTGVAQTSLNWRIATVDAANNTTYTGDGSSGIYIADAQLNDGSSALAYYDTTASAYNAPRFDYDPVTLAAKGLLVEESRANLLLQSNDFQTSWTPTNITRTLNSTLSPSGNVDGVKIAATAAVSTILYQAQIVSATSATYSIYVKQGTGATTANSFLLRNSTTSTNLVGGTINYSTGVWTYTTGSTGVVVSDAGNGWWRLQISATSGITSGNIVVVYVGFVGSPATAGDHLYAYGSQLEAGAFATSYIPTTTSQVTRAADVASVNTLSPWFNSVAGTFYAEYLINSFANSSAAVSLNVSNSGFNVSGSGAARWWNGTTNVVSANTVSTGINRKEAFAFASGARDICLNGGAVATDANVAWPSVPSAMFLGSAASGANTQNINGWLRRVTFYPRRLTNAELQTLTTL